MMATSKGKGKQREPPPSLFLGPPSQNASHVSLPDILQPGATTSSIVTPSLTTTHSNIRSTRNVARPNVEGLTAAALGPIPPRTALPRQQQASEGEKQSQRTDALWAEMQSTLEEVELSAINGTHVFGPDHSKGLEDLRNAQIALAQAWARSEADDAVETADRESKTRRPGALDTEPRSIGDTGTAKGTANGSSGHPGSSGAGAESSGAKLEEETEHDILLARKRREANDKYFQRVNAGVLDVVAKLEEVAVAMRAVEQESRDVWESDSASDSINF